MRAFRFLFFLSLVTLCSCTKSTSDPNAPVDLVSRGRDLFLANCASCHNVDPRLDGSVGPALAGSSLELVTLRVTKAQYPPGYTPKRTTSQMPAFPHLEKEVPALHAFLNSQK